MNTSVELIGADKMTAKLSAEIIYINSSVLVFSERKNKMSNLKKIMNAGKELKKKNRRTSFPNTFMF